MPSQMTPAQIIEHRRKMETMTKDKRMAREIETALFPSGHKEPATRKEVPRCDGDTTTPKSSRR